MRALISCRSIIRDFILTCQDPLPGTQGNRVFPRGAESPGFLAPRENAMSEVGGPCTVGLTMV